jgi:hypothetical protein
MLNWMLKQDFCGDTENFPRWANKIEYWSVHDVDEAPADEALPQIERELYALIQRLSGGWDEDV